MPKKTQLSKRNKKRLSEHGRNLLRDIIHVHSFTEDEIQLHDDDDQRPTTIDRSNREKSDLDDILSLIYESSDRAKVHAINQLIEWLKSNPSCSELIISKTRDLTQSLLSCFRRSTSIKLKIQAVDALLVLSLTLGSGHERFYEEISEPLLNILSENVARSSRGQLGGADNIELSIQALYCLSVSCFVCSSDYDDQKRILRRVGQLLTDIGTLQSSPSMQEWAVAVLECWRFIFQLIEPEDLISGLENDDSALYHQIAALNALIYQNQHVPIRLEAIRAIAIVIELKYNYLREQQQRLVLFDEEPLGSPLMGLDEHLQDLLHESGKKIGKKNHQIQRQLARTILDYLKCGEIAELVSVEALELSINSFGQQAIYDLLHNVLSTGFELHCEHNPIFEELFDIEQKEEYEVLTALEKKEHYSKNALSSKKKTIERKRERGRRYQEFEY